MARYRKFGVGRKAKDQNRTPFAAIPPSNARQLPPTRIVSTVRYPSLEADDALDIAELRS